MNLRPVHLVAVMAALALRGAAANAPATTADPVPRPNIVLILADDLGWSGLGCHGCDFHETPHLDRLARESVRFTDAYAASPVCSPTRAGIFTGKHQPPGAPGHHHLVGRRPEPAQGRRVAAAPR